MLQCVAVCCSVLRCDAVCCSVLQCAAVCYKCGAVCQVKYSVLQCVAVSQMCRSVLQCTAVCCSMLQVWCSVSSVLPVPCTNAQTAVHSMSSNVILGGYDKYTNSNYTSFFCGISSLS